MPIVVAFSSMQKFTNKKHSVNISTIIFNLHRLTCSFLICCSLLTASRQYLGTYINCMLSIRPVPLSVFDWPTFQIPISSKHSFLTFVMQNSLLTEHQLESILVDIMFISRYQNQMIRQIFSLIMLMSNVHIPDIWTGPHLARCSSLIISQLEETIFSLQMRDFPQIGYGFQDE